MIHLMNFCVWPLLLYGYRCWTMNARMMGTLGSGDLVYEKQK